MSSYEDDRRDTNKRDVSNYNAHMDGDRQIENNGKLLGASKIIKECN